MPVTGSLAVQAVAVNVSGFSGIEGRQILIEAGQVAADIGSAISAAMSVPDGRACDVSLDLTQVILTSPASAFAFGGASSITGTLTIVDATSGAVLFGPTEIRGMSQTLRVPGLIGVATSPVAQRDYEQTINGFAAAVRALVTGEARTPMDA